MSRKLPVDSVSRVDYLYESSQSSTSRRLVWTSRHVRVERLKKLGEYKYDASSRGRPNPFFPLLTWTRRRLLDARVEPSSRRRPLDARRRGSGAPPSPAPRALLLLLRLAPLLAPPAPRALLLFRQVSLSAALPRCWTAGAALPCPSFLLLFLLGLPLLLLCSAAGLLVLLCLLLVLLCSQIDCWCCCACC